MRLKPTLKETKTDISSDEKACAILANPDAPRWQTAWECMMQELRGKSHEEPPLDHLGRTPRERKGRYGVTVDELLGPSPYEDQGDGKDAFGNDVKINTKAENDMPVPRGTIKNEDERQVIMLRDHNLELPELHLRVHVMGPPEDTRGFARLFSRAYCEAAEDLYSCDLAVFTGGPDVDPAYYGASRHPSTYVDEERDYQDLTAYMTCLEEGIPMLGVCRGAQFLAVMAGYKLAQDLTNHTGDHPMYCEKDKFLMEKVSSVHHQCVIPGEGMEILGKSFKSSERWLDEKHRQFRNNPKDGYTWDLEAFFIRDTCALGVQGHPEYAGYHAFAQWTLKQINEYVILNPDVDWVGDRRRLKPEFLKERDAMKKQHREILTTIPSEN